MNHDVSGSAIAPESNECYICYEPASADNPHVTKPQCLCMGSHVIHNACFKKLLDQGKESCSICKTRWFFLPVISQYTFVRHGTTYSVECMKDQRGHFYGPYKEWYVDGSGVRTLHIDTQYRNGLLDGWFLVYNMKGRLRRRVFYEDGIKQGLGVYYVGTAIRRYSSFLNGVLHGQTLYLKKDGSYNFVRDYYYGSLMNKKEITVTVTGIGPVGTSI